MKQKELFNPNSADTEFDYFNAGKVLSPLTKNTFPQAFFSIVGLFAEDCNYELRECSAMMGKLSIKGGTGEKTNELYLRYKYNGNDISLVVARVRFIHQSSGNMTRLYEILQHIQKKYKLGKIAIESVLTEEMKQWCIKNKMIESLPNNYVQQ